MGDNPLDRIPNFDRVSVRAVVVMEGQDPGPLLAAAGIVDPVAVPVVFGEDAPDRGFGDGLTANVSAVVEFDQEVGSFGSAPDGDEHDAAASEAASRGRTGAAPAEVGTASRSGPPTIMLPTAFGLQPMAPVRR